MAQYAGIIKEQNVRLNNQVEKVLQIAKIEKGAFLLKKEKVNLTELLEKIVQNCQSSLSQKNGTIRANLPENPIFVEADRLHLTNVYYNLLENAEKYCHRTPTIEVNLTTNQNEVLTEISDNGIGIHKDHINKVFDKFFRVPTGNVHNVKGFGLGLYYIKNIIEAHHWSINLESEPDVGTTVKIFAKIQS